MNKIIQIHLKVFPNPSTFLRSLSVVQYVVANRKTKRGSMLNKMIINKDKNKKWLLNFTEKPSNAKSVFEKVHRPNKRQNMLNTLFIKNITDVLSTGDIAPDIMGYGVEINGVKVSPCYKLLNVYWQIPPDSFESHEKISIALNSCAPRLRAELISRNVMGRVPHIFFVRDITNSKMAEFENAIRDADLGPENELSIIPDDSFTKDILVFKTPKDPVVQEKEKQSVKTTSKNDSNLPQRPTGMKSDVFGLNHDIMMNKVVTSKTKLKPSSQDSAVISSEFFPSAELFDNIPGIPLQPEQDREKLLKQFQVERKMMKNQKSNHKITKEDCLVSEEVVDEYVEDRFVDSGDYVEEETPENPFC